jgi:hypothetical protein
VSSEQKNAASEKIRADAARYGDRRFLEHGLHALLAPGFVREDRRCLIALPTADAARWIDQLLTFFDLGHGTPSFGVNEIVAVRHRCTRRDERRVG